MKIDGKEIARVFPRKTHATPDDNLSFIGLPTWDVMENGYGIDEVHISVTFTYDIPIAEQLYKAWTRLGVPVKMGGPAFNDRMSNKFIPGMYIKKGYTFTSRGCPKSCWFCSVYECSKGKIIELPITEGWNILDDNICATSEKHFLEVMKMLKRQKENPIFTGGIEPGFIQPWQAKLMKEVGTKRLYCAYDTPDDYEPLVNAGKIFMDAGFTKSSHSLCCYVLIGYHGDTFEKAEKRLIQTIKAGFVPYAMLFRDKQGNVNQEWKKFQREWCRPQIVTCKIKEYS